MQGMMERRDTGSTCEERHTPSRPPTPPVYGGQGGGSTTPRQGETEQGPYLLVGDILEIRRRHRPLGGPFETTPEPQTLDDCLLVRQRDIEQFHFRSVVGWTSYPELVARHQERRRAERSAHVEPYREAEVFAPMKIILAERDRPIRAVLAFEPVYPLRGKLATVRPGQSLRRVYAALGVLNSDFGQAFYSEMLREERGRERSEDNLDSAILKRIPVARWEHRPEKLDAVAQLAYQIATLYEAQEECGRSFPELLRTLRERLTIEICRLLGLTEPEAERLVRLVRGEDAVQLVLPEEIQLPPLPPFRLLSEDEEARLEALAAQRKRSGDEEKELEALEKLRYWQELLGTPLPSDDRIDAAA